MVGWNRCMQKTGEGEAADCEKFAKYLNFLKLLISC